MADEIKASPQGALAGFLGSLGQTAYRAGRGMDEGMQPLRANHPVKTTLADFLLTSPLRSAGNALQDWTGTPRDITPEEPYSRLLSGKGMTTRLDPRVLDVAQFAGPVAGRLTGTIRGLPEALKDAALAAYGPAVSASHVIKPKGGNWLRGDVEMGLGDLKPYVRREGYNGHTAENGLADQAMHDWVDKQLTRYVKNDLATPEDPVRALAERGVTHMQDLEQIWPNAAWPGTRVTQTRRQGEFPDEGMGQTPLARAWELGADSTFRNTSAGEFLKRPQYDVHGAFPMSAYDEAAAQRHIDAVTKLAETEPTIAENVKRFPLSINPVGPVHTNPWLAKVPPETPVYSLDNSGGLHNLGFDHLIDELKNATNPDSGLPRELLLKYSDLGKVSVPQAVERVAKINQWREAQKAIANAEKAQNPATFLHKEYPDQGYKWVELKQAEAPTGMPEGWTQIEDKAGLLRAVSTDGQRVLGNDMPELIKNIYLRHPDTPGNPRKALEEALKYEGDTMGHCVGGYCPDVAEGRSRILSLRDRKGMPHVTVELQPVAKTKVDQREVKKYMAEAEERAKQLPNGYTDGDIYQIAADMAAAEIPPRIVQIKGKGNKAPVADYLPFVQDFVRSGKWSDVGDPQNAGLRRYGDVFNVNEQRGIEAAGEAVPEHDWLTGEEIQRLHNAIYPEGKRLKYDASGNIVDDAEKFASGGLVEYHPLDVDARVDELKRELFNG
jgi:hypothetical protein